MAIIWADDFSMYGDTDAPMLDGLYAGTPTVSISDDPAGSGVPTMRVSSNTNGDGYARMVLPSSQLTIGAALRFYISGLPTSSSLQPGPIQFRSAANGILVTINVGPDGRISAYYGGNGDGASGTLLGTTSVPVITSNAWPHIEAKVFFDAAVGTVEVRVNGAVVLDLENLNIGSTPCGQFYCFNDSDNPAYYIRDLVIWDGTGSVNNDFIGQCSVFYRKPIATLAPGGWISNADADADETVAKPRLANVLTAAGVISSGNVVRINSTYYSWTSGSVDSGAPAGTSANPWLVAMGASTAEAMANLYDAIGATGSPGVTYSTALTAHTTVTPFGLTETTVAVVPTNGTTVSMTFSETGANTSWLSTSAFQFLIHDAIRMSASYNPAVEATGTVTFTGLPAVDETVTINGQVYVFKAAAAGALEVTIGADANETGANFAAKVNSNSIVVTGANVGGVVTLTAISAGAAGNTITLAEAAANTTVSGATLTGGEDVTYPTAFEVALEPLPDDITSIRAVIPIVRAAKVDSGDGNLQVSFGVSEPSYDDGPDTPITTAFTFWGNATMPFVSEINPLTAAPWAPGEFNLGARMKVARTL